MRLLLALIISLISLHAESSVTLTGIHLCCGGCDKAAISAASSVGATAAIDKQGANKVLVIKGADDALLGKALAALSEAGFSGVPDRAEVKLPILPAKAELKGAVVSGLHNCCGKCAKAITSALTGVTGAEHVELDGKKAVVTGSVDVQSVVAALRKAGLDGSVAATPAK